MVQGKHKTYAYILVDDTSHDQMLFFFLIKIQSLGLLKSLPPHKKFWVLQGMLDRSASPVSFMGFVCVLVFIFPEYRVWSGELRQEPRPAGPALQQPAGHVHSPLRPQECPYVLGTWRVSLQSSYGEMPRNWLVLDKPTDIYLLFLNFIFNYIGQ